MEEFYKCLECGAINCEEDMDVIHTTYEDIYGVSDEFMGSTPCDYYVCPDCHSDEIRECPRYEFEAQFEDEEWE